jgi:hypothetical protein
VSLSKGGEALVNYNSDSLMMRKVAELVEAGVSYNSDSLTMCKVAELVEAPATTLKLSSLIFRLQQILGRRFDRLNVLNSRC